MGWVVPNPHVYSFLNDNPTLGGTPVFFPYNEPKGWENNVILGICWPFKSGGENP